jgi:hypothetical protein
MNNSDHEMQAGYPKAIYIDRLAASQGRPAWVVKSIPVGHAYSCESFELHGTVVSMGSKDKPLTPEGPAFWLETHEAVTLHNWSSL